MNKTQKSLMTSKWALIVDHYEKIKQKIKELIEQFGIRAMKFHPNVTEVDLNTSYGKERTEAILCACGECGLPLIIHGGRSSILKNTEKRCLKKISN